MSTPTVVTFLLDQSLEINLPLTSRDKDGKVERKIILVDLKHEKFYSTNKYFYTHLEFRRLESQHDLYGSSNYLLNIFGPENHNPKWFCLHLSFPEGKEEVSVLSKRIEFVDSIDKEVVKDISHYSDYPGNPNWFFASRRDPCIDINDVYLIKFDDITSSKKTIPVTIEKFPLLLSAYGNRKNGQQLVVEYERYKNKDNKENDNQEKKMILDSHQCWFIKDGECDCKYSNNDPILSRIRYNSYTKNLYSNLSSSSSSSNSDTVKYSQVKKIQSCLVSTEGVVYSVSYKDGNVLVSEARAANASMEERTVSITKPTIGHFSGLEFHSPCRDSVILKLFVVEGEDWVDSFDYYLIIIVNFFSSAYQVVDKKMWDDKKYHSDRCHSVLQDDHLSRISTVEKNLTPFLPPVLVNLVISFLENPLSRKRNQSKQKTTQN
jgi:hypothetical protein